MQLSNRLAAWFILSAAPLACAATQVPEPMGVVELQQAFAKGTITSEASVKLFRGRIATIDDAGPKLSAVLALMPDAITIARKRDAERLAGKVRGPLHGIPILIKDNIEVAGPIPTTAGSLALAGNITGRDAPLVKGLRNAGAIILGKTNLSEWANFRSSGSTSGWSAVGGLTRNPHILNRNACGSSSGSGAAVAAGLAAAAIGTETDGSITCPASINGIVGFKPSLGMISRTHIIPLAHSQDTAGPMTKTVHDAALMMNAMSGLDEKDPATAEAEPHRVDFTAGLSTTALKGKKIGVLRDRLGQNPGVIALFDAAIRTMKLQGTEIVEIKESREGLDGLGEAEFNVLLFEFKHDLNHYLATAPKGVKTRSLADLIQFNNANKAREMRWFGQDIFEMAQAKDSLDSPAYKSALERSKLLAGDQGIDRLLRDNKVDMLVTITAGPAWTTDLANGDNFIAPSASQLPAVAGYPHLTVPMGLYHNLPVGLSFIGSKWDDARVLAMGYAYEQASKMRRFPKFLTMLEP